MTEHKYTDEEIIRALGCCYTNDSNDCYKCPYTAESTAEMFCDKKLQKDALDLINSQKTEIERLQKRRKKSPVDTSTQLTIFDDIGE